MIIKILQLMYMLFLLPVCFYICQHVQIFSRKALEQLAKRNGYSKEKTIWIFCGSRKLIAKPSNEVDRFVFKPMVVITFFQPVLFLIFARLGLYISNFIF